MNLCVSASKSRGMSGVAFAERVLGLRVVGVIAWRMDGRFRTALNCSDAHSVGVA